MASRWEQLKKAEKGRASVMDGIPVALPALLFASKVQRRRRRRAWTGGTWSATPGRSTEHRAGALLDVVDEVRLTGEDPETELRLRGREHGTRTGSGPHGDAAETP